jgi:hypothetical protein
MDEAIRSNCDFAQVINAARVTMVRDVFNLIRESPKI